MQDLFVEELRDIYHAEKQITRALPKIAKAATAPELKQAFELHLEQTRGQIERLDKVFEQLDLPKRAKKCEAMEGLLEEARSTMEEIEDATLLDVGMIINAQKVEHYEIAAYGSLVALAKQLGHGQAAKLLEETLEEEKETDQKLNEVALTVATPVPASGQRARQRAVGLIAAQLPVVDATNGDAECRRRLWL
jgi:ferritin-like metal-binding protein YciE